MDVVEYLLEQRRRSYTILQKNSVKQEVVTGHCPQCQQLKQEMEYQHQYTDPTYTESESEQIIQQPVVHTYTDNESESTIESESVIESEELESISESEIKQQIESESEVIEQQPQQNPSLPLFL